MSDPVAELKRQLHDAAARQTRSAKRPGWLRRRWTPPALVVAAILVGGTATAAVVRLAAAPSAPLNGRLPAGLETVSGRNYRFALFPSLQVGQSGWCEAFVFYEDVRAPGGGFGCGGPIPPQMHVIAGDVTEISGGRALATAIVDASVAQISLNGRLVTPAANSELPSGWKAAVAVVPNSIPGHNGFPSFTAIASNGRPLPTIDPNIANTRLGNEPQPSEAVSPTAPPRAACSIRLSRPVPGVEPLSARILVGPPRPAHVNGQALLSCAETTYLIDHATLVVALLQDAGNPDRTPMALPGAQPVPGRPGAVALASPFPDAFLRRTRGNFGLAVNPLSALVARRVGRRWLVVQGGTSNDRFQLLAAIQAH